MNEENHKDYFNTKNAESTMKTVIIVLIVCMILAVLGVGFGIYSTIQVNRINNDYYGEESTGANLTEDDDDTDEAIEFVYGKPSKAEEIEFITISYNDNKDFVDIYKNEDDQGIDYYTYNEDGETISDTVETDPTEIIKFIFDNSLENLGDYTEIDNEKWSVEVDFDNKYSYASGDSDTPEWFNELLKKLDVDNKGYKSKNL